MIRFASPEPIDPTPLSPIRALVASDDQELADEIGALLLENHPDCSAHCVSPIELVADRAAHVNPGLVIVALPSDAPRAYRVMREVSQALSSQVLAIGPADDPQLILRTLHEGGADEYLDQRRLADELGAALLRFRRRGTTTPSRGAGRVVSVLAPSGGSGGSTLAVNLSVALACQHRHCGLLDLCLTTGDLSAMLNVQGDHGLVDFSANLDRLDRQMFEQFFARHSSGVRLLAAPLDLSQALLVTPRAVRQAVAMARAQFPHVIIDLDNVVEAPPLEAIWQSDALLLVLRLDYTALRSTRRTLQYLHHKGIDANRIQLIANRVGERNQLSVREAEQAVGQAIFDQIPLDVGPVNAAINAGVPVVLHRPRTRVSRRLTALATRIAEHTAEK
jgi:pilus assembly protein CpaE